MTGLCWMKSLASRMSSLSPSVEPFQVGWSGSSAEPWVFHSALLAVSLSSPSKDSISWLPREPSGPICLATWAHSLHNFVGYAPAPVVLFLVTGSPPTQTRSVPLSWMCLWPPLHRCPSTENELSFVMIEVLFLYGLPKQQRSKVMKWICLYLKRSSIGLNCQSRLEAGFSSVKTTPCLRHSLITRQVKRAQATPYCSFTLDLKMLRMPWRALDHTVHGVPRCTNQTCPPLIKPRIKFWMPLLRRLYCLPLATSKGGSVRNPAFLMASDRHPVPAKSSTIDELKPVDLTFRVARLLADFSWPCSKESVVICSPKAFKVSALRQAAPLGRSEPQFLEGLSATLSSDLMCRSLHTTLAPTW